MYKFIEWLSGYFAAVNGIECGVRSLTFIYGYGCGYEQGEKDSVNYV